MSNSEDDGSSRAHFIIGFILAILALLNTIIFQDITTIILTLGAAVYCFYVAGIKKT